MEIEQSNDTQNGASKQKYPLCLIAQDIQSPENVGSLFRIADAFGVEHLYLTGSCPVPPNDKLRKTARATEKAVVFSYHADALEVVSQLKHREYRIISLEITNNSTDIRQFELKSTDRIALIVGAERNGVHQSLLDRSDDIVHIPMYGQNSSMNLAVACGIAVFTLLQQMIAISVMKAP